MKVINLRKEKYTVYIGRPSIFGNPFQIGRDGTRKEVILRYELWVRGQAKVLNAIEKLPADAVLGCYCRPQRCHGDVIMEIWRRNK